MATERRTIEHLKETYGDKVVGRVVTTQLAKVYVIVGVTPTGVETRLIASKEEPVNTEDTTPYSYQDDVPVLVLDRDVVRDNHRYRWDAIARSYPKINQPF